MAYFWWRFSSNYNANRRDKLRVSPRYLEKFLLAMTKISSRKKIRVFLLAVFSMIATGNIVSAGQGEIDKQYQQARTLKEFEQIANKIQKILKKEPGNPEWQWRLARSHYSIAKRAEDTKNHHYDQCIRHSSQALEVKPDSAISYFFRALCRGKQ